MNDSELRQLEIEQYQKDLEEDRLKPYCYKAESKDASVYNKMSDYSPRFYSIEDAHIWMDKFGLRLQRMFNRDLKLYYYGSHIV